MMALANACCGVIQWIRENNNNNSMYVFVSSQSVIRTKKILYFLVLLCVFLCVPFRNLTLK